MSGVGAALALLAAGAVVAGWLVGSAGSPGRRRAWALALAAPLGFGLASLVAVGWRALFGAPLGFGMAVVLLGALFTAAAIGRILGRPARPLAPEPLESGPPTALIWAGGVALLAAAVTAARAAAAYWVEIPLGAYDAVATWNLRARLLFSAPGDLATALDATNYPLLLPGAIAFQSALSGGALEVAARATGLAFLAATAALLALAPALRFRATGLLAAALFLATPFAVGQGSSQEADVPTACLLLASAALLGARLRRTPGPPAELAGLALGLLVWTKNEGLLWALLALAGLAFVARETLRRDALRLALGAAPAVVALVLFKVFWAPARGLSVAGFLAGESLGRLFDLGRWRRVGAALLERVDPTTGPFPWGLVWAFLAVAALAGFALRPAATRAETRFLGLFALLAAACVPIVYVLTPLPLDWHLATSLDRLLLQLYPLALAAAAAAVADLLAAAPPRGERAG